MSMLEIKNTKADMAIKKLRELYPDDSLGDAIIMVVDRVQKAEEAIKKYRSIASEAQERAYRCDSRYCELLVEKRQLKEENKALKKALYAVYGTHDEEFTFVDVNKLEEMEK